MMLARQKLEAFKTWLDNKGVGWREGKGVTQALQVCTPEDGWAILYNVADTPYHLKVGLSASELVTEFLAFQNQYAELVDAARLFAKDFEDCSQGQPSIDRYQIAVKAGLISAGEVL